MRVCEECGVKMPRFKPRMRHEDGRLLCAGCHPDGQGAPGRPVGHHGTRDIGAEIADHILDRVEEMRKEAHDSGDGKIIYHCPFCGGGDVVGRSDGTAMCDFCHTAFTVQVQPERSAMPQTSPDGTPLDMPGMPGDPTHPDAAAPGETPPPGAGPPEGTPPGPAGAPATPPPGPPPGPPPPPETKAASFYLTAQGMALDEDAYIRHLAIKHADDKAAVIEDVRKSNRED